MYNIYVPIGTININIQSTRILRNINCTNTLNITLNNIK